jgi:hypothetical protein
MPKALVITRPVSVEELEAVASREPQGRLRVRILAMRLVALGQSASQAAHALGQTTSRVCKWVHRFNAEGLDGLRERNRVSSRNTWPGSRRVCLRALKTGMAFTFFVPRI